MCIQRTSAFSCTNILIPFFSFFFLFSFFLLFPFLIPLCLSFFLAPSTRTQKTFSAIFAPLSLPSGSFALIPCLTLTRWYSHRLNRRIVCARLNEARHRNSLEHFSNERRKVKEKHVKDETTFSFFFSFFVYIYSRAIRRREKNLVARSSNEDEKMVRERRQATGFTGSSLKTCTGQYRNLLNILPGVRMD